MSCYKCTHLEQDSLGDFCEIPGAHYCSKKPSLANLKSFPFESELPCFELDFWLSEFASEVKGKTVEEEMENYKNAQSKWAKKYLKEELKERVQNEKSKWKKR